MNFVILPVGVKCWHMSTSISVEPIHLANGKVQWYFCYPASWENTLAMTN
ncbi:hypothetical protein SLEP1_g24616 [Rubroshorea leprosula]|uniref:Uncharacterized protein n=1 Tax=Rubroshorea leprosula TaxID=152421 RepID=A0AAV5JNJ0_9ROSI|nr:hypothetical protein SLEP1_g24616 [Rubroshorea leprosula]